MTDKPKRLVQAESKWMTFNEDGSVAEYGWLWVDASGVVRFVSDAAKAGNVRERDAREDMTRGRRL